MTGVRHGLARFLTYRPDESKGSGAAASASPFLVGAEAAKARYDLAITGSEAGELQHANVRVLSVFAWMLKPSEQARFALIAKSVQAKMAGECEAPKKKSKKVGASSADAAERLAALFKR